MAPPSLLLLFHLSLSTFPPCRYGKRGGGSSITAFSTFLAVFCDFGGEIDVSLPARMHVIICKSLKFQLFCDISIFRTALSPRSKAKKLHHFAKKSQKWWRLNVCLASAIFSLLFDCSDCLEGVISIVLLAVYYHIAAYSVVVPGS